jgi:hypothetical protein
MPMTRQWGLSSDAVYRPISRGSSEVEALPTCSTWLGDRSMTPPFRRPCGCSSACRPCSPAAESFAWSEQKDFDGTASYSIPKMDGSVRSDQLLPPEVKANAGNSINPVAVAVSSG